MGRTAAQFSLTASQEGFSSGETRRVAGGGTQDPCPSDELGGVLRDQAMPAAWDGNGEERFLFMVH